VVPAVDSGHFKHFWLIDWLIHTEADGNTIIMIIHIFLSCHWVVIFPLFSPSTLLLLQTLNLMNVWNYSSYDTNVEWSVNVFLLMSALWRWEVYHYTNKYGALELYFHHLQVWANNNDMVVNFNKTKEIVMGPPSKTSHLPPLHFSALRTRKLSKIAWHQLGRRLFVEVTCRGHHVQGNPETLFSKAT